MDWDKAPFKGRAPAVACSPKMWWLRYQKAFQRQLSRLLIGLDREKFVWKR